MNVLRNLRQEDHEFLRYRKTLSQEQMHKNKPSPKWLFVQPWFPRMDTGFAISRNSRSLHPCYYYGHIQACKPSGFSVNPCTYQSWLTACLVYGSSKNLNPAAPHGYSQPVPPSGAPKDTDKDKRHSTKPTHLGKERRKESQECTFLFCVCETQGWPRLALNSLCSQRWTSTSNPPACWDYRVVPSHTSSVVLRVDKGLWASTSPTRMAFLTGYKQPDTHLQVVEEDIHYRAHVGLGNTVSDRELTWHVWDPRF